MTMKQVVPPRWLSFFDRFRNARDGAAAVEVALASMVMAGMVLSVIDFGLAFGQQNRMNNAVRAGSQFALVRHPALGPEADSSEALTSVQTIRDAVVDAAPFLDSDPGAGALDVDVNCQCTGGAVFACPAGELVVPPCTDFQTSVAVTLTQPHELMLTYPEIGSTVTLRATNVVRLN